MEAELSCFWPRLQDQYPHVHVAALLTTIPAPEGCFTGSPFTEFVGKQLRVFFVIDFEEQSIISHWAHLSVADRTTLVGVARGSREAVVLWTEFASDTGSVQQRKGQSSRGRSSESPDGSSGGGGAFIRRDHVVDGE